MKVENPMIRGINKNEINKKEMNLQNIAIDREAKAGTAVLAEEERIPEADFTGKVQAVAGKKRRVSFVTLGCKVNQYETEAIRELFLADGFEEVDPHAETDVYVVNTCTVTNMAAKKSRQMLARGKKKNPACVVIAVGCYVQREHQKLKEMNGIDILIGNHRKKDIVTILDEFYQSMETMDLVEEGYNKPSYEDLKISRRHEKTRATIKIQDGCNQFCTYCIIPYARGKVRSRRPGMILEEIGGLVAEGYQEFVITGIHLTSYGIDFSEKMGLIDLLEEIDQVPGVKRIRLGSLEPRLITEDFTARIAKLKHICPHFHLSLQSGSDGVLERMNRRYRSQDFADGVKRLRQVYANPAITTDVIVGFPGETDKEFADGLAFVEDIGFADLHVFKYSKREGTKAAGMANQVAEPVKNERSAKMIAAGESSKQNYLAAFLGTEVEVLWEDSVEIEGGRYMIGHTVEYIKVYYQTEENFSDKSTMVILKAIYQDGILAESKMEK